MRTPRTSNMRTSSPKHESRVVRNPSSFPPQNWRSVLHGTRENFENFETEHANLRKFQDAQHEEGVTEWQKRAYERECFLIAKRQPALIEGGLLGLSRSRAIKVRKRETADFPEYQYQADAEHWASFCRERKAERAERRREDSIRALTADVIDLTGASIHMPSMLVRTDARTL
jgi:hypothetical protein